MYASPSGFGDSSGFGGQHCEQGVPTEAALLAILAAFAVSFGILYKTSTTTPTTRKKRFDEKDLNYGDLLMDVVWKGNLNHEPWDYLDSLLLDIFVNSIK